MIFNKSDFGCPGERDDDGYCGYYPLGTQYLIVDGSDVLVALRFNSCPEDVVVVARRKRAQEVALSSRADDAFLGFALRGLLQEEGVKRVRVLTGVAAPLEAT
jgi:hypothetical protein